MPKTPIRVLMVEDSPTDAKLLEQELRRGGLDFTSARVDTEPDFIAALSAEPDIVLCDWQMPQFDSQRALALLQEQCPDTPLVLVSGSIGEEAAVKIIKLGASDYVLKDRRGRLVLAVQQALSTRDLQKSARLAQLALRRSERQLAEAQRVARLGSWVWEPVSGAVSWSDAMFTVLGLDRVIAQPSFETFLSVLHPDDRPAAVARVAALMDGADEFANDFRIVRQDGTCVWIHSRGRATRDELGRVVRVEGTDQDITDRKRSEAELQFRHAILRSQSEASPDGILVVGPDGRVLSWNRRFLEVWGIPLKLLEAGDDSPLLALAQDLVADPATFSARVAAIYAEPELHSRDEVVLADGRTLDRHSSPIQGDDRKLLGRVWYFRDITERKRAEDALRESESRFRGAFEDTNVAMVITDLRNRFVRVNAAFARLFGYAPEEILTLSMADLTHAEHLSESSAQREALLAVDSTYFELEKRYVHKDGHVFWGLTNVSLVSDPEGRPRHYIDQVQDISARKLAEVELAEQERATTMRAAVAVAVAQVGDLPSILRKCCDVLVRDLGVAFARVWTLNAEEQVLELQCSAGLYTHTDGAHRRIPMGQFKIGQIAQERRPHLTNAVAGDPRVPEQEWVTRERMVAFAGYPLLVEGRLVGVLAMFSRSALGPAAFESLTGVADLVAQCIDRKQAEKALLSSQRRLQFVLSSSPAVLFTIGIVDNQVRGINWISDNLMELLGYPPDAVLDPNWWMGNIHPEDHADVMVQTREKLFDLGKVTHEFRFRHGKGQYRWTRGEIRLIRDAMGQAVKGVGSWSDVTERRHLEDQFRQAQKMEAVGQLAGGVAHDFNNLLTIINGYSEMMLAQLPTGDPGREPVAAIREAGERAARLTQQLLAFSRKAIVEPKILDLNELVTESAKLLRRLIGEHIALTVVPDLSLSRIKVDPGQLEQVIMNLVVNARDAMPTGGRLSIETREITLGNDDLTNYPDLKPGRYARLTVTDTGQGMTDEVKGKIFEPFFTTKGVGKGTGLGLAVVHGVMQQCGGFIGLESEVGVGTTFNLLLPVAPEVAAGPASGIVRSGTRGTETVLLVEDDDAVRTIARLSLASQGYKVLEAGRGADAIRMAEEYAGTIHLLVTDVVMPEMGGRQLAEAVRVRRPGLRVLYMSGYTDDAVVLHGVVAATDAFLQKPFTPLGLARKVRVVLDRTA